MRHVLIVCMVIALFGCCSPPRKEVASHQWYLSPEQESIMLQRQMVRELQWNNYVNEPLHGSSYRKW